MISFFKFKKKERKEHWRRVEEGTVKKRVAFKVAVPSTIAIFDAVEVGFVYVCEIRKELGGMI